MKLTVNVTITLILRIHILKRKKNRKKSISEGILKTKCSSIRRLKYIVNISVSVKEKYICRRATMNILWRNFKSVGGGDIPAKCSALEKCIIYGNICTAGNRTSRIIGSGFSGNGVSPPARMTAKRRPRHAVICIHTHMDFPKY